MSSSQLKMLHSKTNQLIIDLSPWGGNLHKDRISAIRKAIENYNEIIFEYTDSKGNRTNRKVEPYSLVLKGQKWYLYGWCLVRQDFRFFKLSRIKELIITEKSYHPREISAQQLPWDNEWQKSENMVELDLLFEKEMEGIVDEWFGEETVMYEDGRIMAKVILPENNWLYGFILSFGTGVEVLNPPHIRRIIAEIAAGIQKKYFET